MSGTSLDGIDLALTEIEGFFLKTKVKLKKFSFYPYNYNLQKKILNLCNPKKSNLNLISDYNFKLAKLFADSILKFIKEINLTSKDIDLIASHGQTIYHSPPLGGKMGNTLQIGDISVISNLTGILTVGDFRPADMALGGQGAPLVPYVDYLIFRNSKKNRLVLNIGGISNLTYLPASGGLKDVLAFDCGPGNMIIDCLIKIFTKGKKKYDQNGSLALKGKINFKILKELMKHPFLKKIPPKSTGREAFGESFTFNLLKKYKLSQADFLATLSAFTSEAVYYNIKKFIPLKADEIILSGGGAYNNFIINYLKDKLKVKFYLSDYFGIPLFAKEAISFTVLGNETLHSIPNNLPSATGASKSTILGKICLT
ncbi:MAG: anhydro-N-acetylmuramic acid kinase [Armatimonadetes bacterium]|nr:anhydro-N-acetylmuramic acid kinase [Armatimonadota bacterium]